MSKRSLETTEVQLKERNEGSLKIPALTGAGDAPSRPPNEVVDDMGEYEDPWEDDIESEEDDEEIIVNEDEDEDADPDAMDVDVQQPAEDDDLPQSALDTFLPGKHKLSKDEILEPDQSVYEMLHHMNVTWPCLSFDVLKDGLGNERAKYPATTYLVAGTQADTAKNNEVLVMKMSQMHRTQKDEDDSDSDDNDEDDDTVDEDALLEYRSIPHVGGINRIRAQPLSHLSPLLPPTTPYYAATWSETGKVHIFDIRQLMEALDVPGHTFDKARVNKPVYTSGLHKAEGFAMDWASFPENSAPRLLTGDMHSKIYLTSANETAFSTSPNAYTSHTSSVEDIQWSPAEKTVFASCSADQTVRIWDVRKKDRTSVITVEDAHDSDVNVISWNHTTAYLLASGGDEGGIKIWDLRNLKASASSSPSPVASFTWHTASITSLEWHPTEDSVFAASGADDQVTLWDLSVEHDEDEAGSEGLGDVPPQLLFVHQGQKDIKEIHWCKQMPGTVVTTASDGFNVFKTISV